jgi:hypothetical protein
MKIIRQPVIARDGHTYEESAIREWIERATEGGSTSGVQSCWQLTAYALSADGKVPLAPNTGVPLMGTELILNHQFNKSLERLRELKSQLRWHQS